MSQIIHNTHTTQQPRVISVTGGKGGIGKTHVSVNLAITLAQSGMRTLLFDADLALANIDILLGLKPKHTIQDVLKGAVRIEDILLDGPFGLKIIPATTGVSQLSNLSVQESHGLIHQFERVSQQFDIMIVDTAAGISNQVLNFVSAAQEVIVVVCNDPSSITDAYALIKVMNTQFGIEKFRVLSNMVQDAHEGVSLFNKLNKTAQQYLDIVLDYSGYLPYDDHVKRALRTQRAVVEMFPNAPVSKIIKQLAQTVVSWPQTAQTRHKTQFFFEHFFNTHLNTAEVCV